MAKTGYSAIPFLPFLVAAVILSIPANLLEKDVDRGSAMIYVYIIIMSFTAANTAGLARFTDYLTNAYRS